jgi:hypothetical protein
VLEVRPDGVGGEPETGPEAFDENLREVQARHDERAGLDEGGDDLVVHVVAMVDDVDAELDRHEDAALVDQMPADERAP